MRPYFGLTHNQVRPWFEPRLGPHQAENPRPKRGFFISGKKAGLCPSFQQEMKKLGSRQRSVVFQFAVGAFLVHEHCELNPGGTQSGNKKS